MPVRDRTEMSFPALRTECKTSKISAVGQRHELIAKLEEHDIQKQKGMKAFAKTANTPFSQADSQDSIQPAEIYSPTIEGDSQDMHEWLQSEEGQRLLSVTPSGYKTGQIFAATPLNESQESQQSKAATPIAREIPPWRANKVTVPTIKEEPAQVFAPMTPPPPGQFATANVDELTANEDAFSKLGSEKMLAAHLAGLHAVQKIINECMQPAAGMCGAPMGKVHVETTEVPTTIPAEVDTRDHTRGTDSKAEMATEGSDDGDEDDELPSPEDLLGRGGAQATVADNDPYAKYRRVLLPKADGGEYDLKGILKLAATHPTEGAPLYRRKGQAKWVKNGGKKTGVKIRTPTGKGLAIFYTSQAVWCAGSDPDKALEYVRSWTDSVGADARKKRKRNSQQKDDEDAPPSPSEL